GEAPQELLHRRRIALVAVFGARHGGDVDDRTLHLAKHRRERRQRVPGVADGGVQCQYEKGREQGSRSHHLTQCGRPPVGAPAGARSSSSAKSSTSRRQPARSDSRRVSSRACLSSAVNGRCWPKKFTNVSSSTSSVETSRGGAGRP